MRARFKILSGFPALFPDRPLLIGALGLGMGILLGRDVLGESAWILAAALIVFGTLCFLTGFKRAPVFLFACALGLIRLTLAYPVLPQPEDGCQLTGRICASPVQTNTGWRVTLDNAARGGKPIDGRVLLSFPEEEGAFFPAYGQIVTAYASLSLPNGARNEGGMDYRFYYFTQGVTCAARAEAGDITLEEGPPGLYGTLLSLRDASTRVLVSLMGQENGSLAAGFLHGDIRGIPEDALNDYRDSGITHLLSVSGLHVSLLVGALLLAFKRVNPLIQLVSITVFLVFYCAFSAFSAPTVRAGIMAVSLLLGRAFARRNDPITSLALSFAAILLVSPFSLFSVGFQLSFAAMLGIFLIYPALHDACKRLPEAFVSLFGVSVAGQAATLPATASYFGRFPLLAVLANFLVVPLSPLVMFPAGLALLLYPVSGALARAAAGVADVTLDMMRAVARMAAAAGAWTFSSPNFAACVLYFLAMACISKECLRAPRTRLRLAALSGALCLVAWVAPRLSRPDAFVAVLDVPYGYAAHLHTPQGDSMIGTSGALEGAAVQSYLRSEGIRAYVLSEQKASGAAVTIGSEQLFIAEGYVEVDGTRYYTEQNGRIRISLHDGAVRAEPYARDAIYAILIEK